MNSNNTKDLSVFKYVQLFLSDRKLFAGNSGVKFFIDNFIQPNDTLVASCTTFDRFERSFVIDREHSTMSEANILQSFSISAIFSGDRHRPLDELITTIAETNGVHNERGRLVETLKRALDRDADADYEKCD